MSRVIRQMSVGMLPRAECAVDDCGWDRDHGRQTRDAAKLHARATGHDVLVITEQRDLYRLDGATTTPTTTSGD
jgi:hypothetical protein